MAALTRTPIPAAPPAAPRPPRAAPAADPHAELRAALDRGDLRVPARGRSDEAARQERLAWLRERSGAALAPLGGLRVPPERLARNAENVIGAVELPVGVAGPLLFLGEAARGVVYAPFATTEGALVASAARGATAITRAGGVRTRVLARRMTRAPVFEFADVERACAFAAWIARQRPPLRERTREVSGHAVLRAVRPVMVDTAVHVVFSYTTGEAAGQNMTTATTWHACRWILDELPALGLAPERFLVEGNLSGDKKAALAGLAGGRGYAVAAECALDEATIARVLKTTAADLLHAHRLLRQGAAQARLVAHNVNVANAVAAIFAATGQDVACVHESSVAHLRLRPAPGGVRARLFLPGLAVGTVGGGTHLPAQHALLELLDCTGPGSAARLAEIVAGFALALDLSTLAALASGEFAVAHERLGRNRPAEPVREDELTPSFFEPGLRAALDVPALRVHAVEPLAASAGASVLGELMTQRFGRPFTLLHRRLHHDLGVTDVVVKPKPRDEEVILMLQSLAAACGSRVAAAHARWQADTGFAGTHLRELAVYAQTDARFRRHAPRVYGVVRDDARERWALVLERLDGVRLMDSADDPSGWTTADVETALRGAGALHAIWLGREAELLRAPWIGRPPTTERMTAMRPLWDALAEHAATEFPTLMPDAELRRQRALVATMPTWWARLAAMPRTLAHNDFNPRNVALRDDADGARLCAYDWELATVHLPQRDAAELLAFVLPPDVGRREVLHLVELHRRAAAEAGAPVPDARTWRTGFALAAADLLVGRFALYLMAHGVRHYAFLDRALATLRRLLDLDLEAA